MSLVQHYNAKGDDIMNTSIGRFLCLLLTITISACAGAKVADQTETAPAAASSKPNLIVIYPFAATAGDVTLNQSIVQRAYRNMSGEDQTASQQKLATDTASKLCMSVAANLTAKGYKAVCLQRGTPVADNNALIVDGEFTDISEGNRLRRLVVGFGAGASTLDSAVHVYQHTDSGSQQLIDFNTHADSGKMPGAVVWGRLVRLRAAAQPLSSGQTPLLEAPRAIPRLPTILPIRRRPRSPTRLINTMRSMGGHRRKKLRGAARASLSPAPHTTEAPTPSQRRRDRRPRRVAPGA